MKYRSKIILTAVITVFLAFLLKNVSAVDSVYQAIYNYTKESERFIVYRTVVKPHKSTLNLFPTYNKWHENISEQEPIWSSYKTEYLIFTKNKIGAYTPSGSTTGVGYAKYRQTGRNYDSFFSGDFRDAKDWVDWWAASEHVKNIEVTDNPEVFGGTPMYTYNTIAATVGDKTIRGANFSDQVFESYNKNAIDIVGATGYFNSLLSTDYTTDKEKLKWVVPYYDQHWMNHGVKGVVKWQTSRSMLYYPGKAENETVRSNDDVNNIYYIMDIELDTNTTNALYNYKAEDPNKKIYVSGIPSTMATWSGNDKFYMLTPGAWLYSKLRDFNGNGWSKPTLGNAETDGLQSGLNLWDNELDVPLDAKKDKKIVVNHIAVELDGTYKFIDKEVVDKEETLTARNGDSSEYNKIDKLYLNGDKTLTTSFTNEKLLKSKDDNIMAGVVQYQYTIIAPKETTKYQVNQLSESALEGKYAGYEYQGFIIIDNEQIEKIIDKEEYLKYNEEALSLGNPNFELLDKTSSGTEETEIIVNLYYKADTKNVNVENLKCVDDDLEKCTLVEGNRKIETTNPKTHITTTLSWDSSELTEKYTVNKKYSVKAENIDVEGYEYKGYKLEEGDKKTENFKKAPGYCSSNSESDITIRFYYVKKTTKKLIQKEKPLPDIPGTLTIQSAVDVSTTCEEYYSVPTNAKNNTSDVYVGIKNTPTYILAGINVEQQNSDDQQVTIYVNMNFGPNSKKWAITVPYSMSYYAIQDLLMYKYQNAMISNAGLSNTKGETLFDSRNFTIYPIKTSVLVLNTSTNTNISYTDTNNWKNYLVTSFKTNYAIPTDNPDDKEENSTNRKNKSFDLLGDIASKYYSPYEEVDNTVDKYITTELAEQYKNIELTGSAAISIELLSEEIFNVIDGNKNKELGKDDLVKLAETTDDKEYKFNEAKGKLGEAETNYRSKCTEGGYDFPCRDAVNDDYKDEKEKCGESECGDGETPHKCQCNDEECPDCAALKSLDSDVRSLNGIYASAETKYNTALGNLKDAYEAEVYAIEHYDEAYYIQENLWKVYKEYNNEELAKLLGLNVKFDYSSGNAKLGNIDLMTVEKHTLELVSDSTQALSGELNDNYCDEQKLAASRQTLSDAQKAYYLTGIEGASWLPNERSAVNSTYYKDNMHTIPITRLNGTRILAGKANYSIDQNNRVGKSKAVQDNMYYEFVENKAEKVIYENVFDVSSSSRFSKSYGVKENGEVAEKQKTNASYNSGNVNSEEFNVYTPLVVTTKVNQDIDIIDQTATNKYSGAAVIQSNSSFTINFYNNKDKVYANNSSKPDDFTSRYKQVTYIKFEFAVTNLEYEDANGVARKYGNKAANEWIGPIYGNYIKAVPYLNTIQGESVTDETYNYYVVAAAINTKERWTEQLLRYINTSLDDLKEEELIKEIRNACGYEGKNKLSYYADLEDKVGTLIIVNRMYDFRVTDLKDLDWKEVFRNNKEVFRNDVGSSYINYHSGIAYYAGLNKWNTKNPTRYNEIVGRTPDEIGSSPQRILPLGPYKNTDTTYISAPKMGYRFSFDLKVTGSGNDNKYVKISPSFYYVSKDGKKFYTEYSSGKEGIYLFYKNSNGQYVRVRSGSDNYKIQFTPNDGYRALVQTDEKNLNSNVVTLGGLTELKLKYSETTTKSQNEAAITYYGEYKLPNSTIAVYVDKNGKYDINKPLTNGYVGVVFDIKAHEADGVDLVYGKNAYNGQTNTSQWDYEGYLGMSKPGNTYSTNLKLEKGTWKIDNATYNQIKGTVILYDTDSKASNDFN